MTVTSAAQVEAFRASHRWILLSLHLLPAAVLFLNAVTGVVSKAPLTIPMIIAATLFIVPLWMKSFRSPQVQRVIIALLVSVLISSFMSHGIRSAVFNIYYASSFLFLGFYVIFARTPLFDYYRYMRAVIIAMSAVSVLAILHYFLVFLGSAAMYQDIRYSFFFDDKSHFSVYLGFFMFCLSNYVRVTVVRADNAQWTWKKRAAFSLFALTIMGVALFVSTTTLSRLGVLFFPLILFILYYLLRLNFQARISPGGSRLLAINLLILVSSFAVFLAWATGAFDEIDNSFFNRVAKLSKLMEDDSFASHVMLIRLAIEAKVHTVFNMIFGVGLGNFQYSLIESGGFVHIAKYKSLLGEFYVGYMPTHSVWASIFVETSFVVSLIVMVVILYYFMLGFALRAFDAPIFIGGLFISSMFYSTVNEAFYIIIWATIIVTLEQVRYHRTVVARKVALASEQPDSGSDKLASRVSAAQ
ncbi:hypothetical protein P7L68_22375 [Tistrella mobilis]|uniref:hypothetical protein n=1 Tax=Tistrella mobilis TaxID=171437 RepID=UPI003558D071